MCSKFIKTAGLVLAVFSFSVFYGQENDENNTAEKLFDQYHKFGVVPGGSLLFTTNEPNAVALNYETVKAFSLGLEYNFLQIHNFNFKIAFFRRVYATKDTKTLKKEDVATPYDVSRRTTVGDYLQSYIPLTAEYIFGLGQGLSMNFGLGPEFLIPPRKPPDGISRSSGSFFVIQDDGTKIGFTDIGNYNKRLYVGGSASVGLNIEVGPLLLRPTLTYHYQPDPMYTYIATTQNLLVSENTVSRHEITGNYVMLSLGILPRRGLFRNLFCGGCGKNKDNDY